MLFPVLALLACSVPVALSLDVVVDLDYARYRGYQENGINKWKGIRFAAPPLGDLRFRAPEPPTEVQGETVEDATQFQPSCLSVGADIADTEDSEDCLFLNLYAPAAATEDSRLPVYVFIQGGGFASNSNRNYDGEGLINRADGNMVVINFNYRVGLYGFLASEEVRGDGNTNAGLLDQRAVFEWVQRYITRFGGDPDHVTIGGCSAGGGSVTLHQTAFGGRNDGLFHAIAGESQSFPAQLTVREAQYQYDYVVSVTGCGGYDANGGGSTLDCLRNLPVEQLQPANVVIPFPNGPEQPPLYMWSNVIDGDFTVDYSYKLFREGNYIPVPSIYGDTTNEGTVFVPNDTASYGEMNEFLRAQFTRFTDEQLEFIDSLYPRAEQFPGAGEYWRTASNAYGEGRYICPGIFITNIIAGGEPGEGPAGDNGDYPTPSQSWNYRYNVMDPDLYAAGLGTTHTEEISAIWGTEFIGGTAPGSYNSTNAGIVPIVQGYWASFIRSFDPNRHRSEGTPEWTAWNPSSYNRILLNTTGTVMEEVPGTQIQSCEYWWSIAEGIQQL